MASSASADAPRRAVPRSYEQTVDVETPELVVLTYSIAGVGSRVLAALTDLAISIGLMVILFIAIAVLQATRTYQAGGRMFESWGLAVLIIGQFGILWGYYVLFEGLMDGQTPGKRLHRLRVVREGGYSVTFGASAVRNLVRVIDMQPVFFYLVGLASILLTKRGRRLGDIAAGTIVVREDVRRVVAEAPAPQRAPARAAPLQTLLSEDEYLVLDRLVQRWSTLEPRRRALLAAQLVERFKAALPDGDRPAGRQLLELHGREQRARARGVASRGETGAGRERQALIAANMPRWNAFAARLAEAQKHGLRRLGEAGVRDFVAEYRAVAADLARLRTASGGRDLDELFQLGRLVGGAHNLLYRDRRVPLRRALTFLFVDVPTEIRRSAAPIGLAALLLFGPAIVTGAAVLRSPSAANDLLSPGMQRRAADAARRARNGEGYVDDPQLFRPVMASSIVSNNVQISFAAFAGGITAGLLTAFLLVANGISFGSVIGVYVHNGAGPLLLAFVAPHGVLELFAICVASGGGFLLASAILMPGRRSRRRALVENGRRAIRLIAGSTLMLLVAGTIEGFISPIEWWPIEAKLAVSGTTLVLLVAYLRSGILPVPAARPDDTPPAAGGGALALGPVTARRAL